MVMTDAIPTPKPKRRHRCLGCGEDLGEWTPSCDAYDTCGEIECNRSSRDAYAQEREEAHERLDRDMGYDRW